MPVFQSLKSGGSYLRGNLAARAGKAGTIADAVTDGDTVRVLLPGSQGLRFLGCDTPEKKIEYAPMDFRELRHPSWTEYFNTMWDDGAWGPFERPLGAALKKYLKLRMHKDVAMNQWKHAVAATEALVGLMEEDRKTLKLTTGNFRIFAAFSHEILDRYSRPLVFANVDTPKDAKRPEIYNVRMIGNGSATPFFMWPNIEPFRKLKIDDAAMPPPKMFKAIESAKRLQSARKQAAAARSKELGIYSASAPLQLNAFELRFLARRAAPDRWLIDIAAGKNRLLPPDAYIDVEHPEDRLFIPSEYVPLFRDKGWKS